MCSLFHVHSLFNTDKIMYFFRFVFVCIPWQGYPLPKCSSPAVQQSSSPAVQQSSSPAVQQSATIQQFHFPWYLFSIKEMSFWKRSPRSTIADSKFYGKNPNASEGSVFLVTCCSLIYGSSAKVCLQTAHSFEPFCLQKMPILSWVMKRLSFAVPFTNEAAIFCESLL